MSEFVHPDNILADSPNFDVIWISLSELIHTACMQIDLIREVSMLCLNIAILFACEHFLSRTQLKANHHHRFFLSYASINILFETLAVVHWVARTRMFGPRQVPEHKLSKQHEVRPMQFSQPHLRCFVVATPLSPEFAVSSWRMPKNV